MIMIIAIIITIIVIAVVVIAADFVRMRKRWTATLSVSRRRDDEWR